MDQTVRLAQEALASPPPELNGLLSSLPNDTKNALASAGLSQPNGHSTTASRVQIIDEEKKFMPQLSTSITEWGLADAGFAYDVVAVFGSQSTGKSTLLNRLFGTTFDVMDELRPLHRHIDNSVESPHPERVREGACSREGRTSSNTQTERPRRFD